MNQNKKIIIILGLISMVLCGFPGCLLLMPGFNSIFGALENIQNFTDFQVGFIRGIIQGGWMICVGGVLILVPLSLGVIMLIKTRKKDPIKDLKPTGVSKDEPIPPPS